MRQPIQPDQIIRSKRKTIGIEVLPGGKVIVRAPLHTSDARIQEALNSRADWLRTAQQKMIAAGAAHQPKRFVEGELFWYLGRQYPLHLVERGSTGLRFDPKSGFLLKRSAMAQAKPLFIEWYREQTRRLTSQLIADYQRRYGFKVGAIRITSAKTRWGSCSGKNNISFTYRLCMAPPSALEYVVVHELVHTRIKNHSAKFWQAVAEILPAWKKERVWLHKHGVQLSLE